MAVSWSGVYVCTGSAPDAACDGDGAVVFESSQTINSTASVAVAPAAGGTVSYVAVNQIAVGYVVKCEQGPAASAACIGDTSGTGFVQPTYLTFGIAAPYSPPFDISQLDMTQMGFAFAAGFVLIAMAFCLGAPIKMLLAVIKGAR